MFKFASFTQLMCSLRKYISKVNINILKCSDFLIYIFLSKSGIVITFSLVCASVG